MKGQVSQYLLKVACQRLPLPWLNLCVSLYNCLSLLVTDSGTGIFQLILENLFEHLFYRVHPDDCFWTSGDNWHCINSKLLFQRRKLFKFFSLHPLWWWREISWRKNGNGWVHMTPYHKIFVQFELKKLFSQFLTQYIYK